MNRWRERFAAPHEHPLIIAHRGASFFAPENTREAAGAGRAAGADAWELDVHLTRDGVPVVLHDESLARTTNVAARFADDPRGRDGWPVSRFNLAELRVLDAGSWFVAPGGGPRTAVDFGTLSALPEAECCRFASGEVRIPTLAEALEWTVRWDWLVNVELKSVPNTEPRLVDAVLAAIERTGSADRVLVSSFDHADVARVARLRPEIATGLLTSTPLFRPDRYVRDLVGADAYHPSATALGAGSDRYVDSRSPRLLRSDDLARLRDQGVPVLVFTVNDVGLASHLAEAGVSGLFSDDPGALIHQPADGV